MYPFETLCWEKSLSLVTNDIIVVLRVSALWEACQVMHGQGAKAGDKWPFLFENSAFHGKSEPFSLWLLGSGVCHNLVHNH